jgi:hypothetical protein
MSPVNFDTANPITLTLDLYIADVQITATDRTDTIVEVRPSNPDKASDVKAAAATRVEYDEGTDTVSVVSKKPRNVFAYLSRTESIDVLVQLPTDSAVRGEVSVGEFRGRGVLGAVRIKTGIGAVRLAEVGPLDLNTGVGDIVVEGVSGSADISAGSGEVLLKAVDGTANVKNSNGRTSVGVVTGDARFKASNGAVEVDRALAGIVATSSNGAIRIGEVVRGKVEANTSNGRVEIGVREGSAAWLDLHTGVGKVYNDLDASGAPEESDPAETVEIRANTKLGDVVIRRSPRTEEDA